MASVFRSFSFGMLLLINVIVSLSFLLCSLAPHMHPEDWWFTGFLGLSFPYLFFLLLVNILIFLFVRPKWALLPVLVLIAGHKTVLLHFPLRTHEDFNVNRVGSEMRVMSWNLRHFIPPDEQYFKPDGTSHQRKVLDQVKKYDPDIICFQEFTTMPAKGSSDPMKQLKDEFGYRYTQFAGEDIFGTKQYSGIAILSKFPILRGGVIPYPASVYDNAESTVFADLLVEKDTIRVYSIHLQSFGFGSHEYNTIDKVRKERQLKVSESKQLLRKMRNTFYRHGSQADFIHEKVLISPYKCIVVGDLNDVPGSYAYTRIRGEAKDAFLEKGTGLGPTFTGSSSWFLRLLPTLRIDYIFHPSSFKTIQFTRGKERLSDHAMLVADITLHD